MDKAERRQLDEDMRLLVGHYHLHHDLLVADGARPEALDALMREMSEEVADLKAAALFIAARPPRALGPRAAGSDIELSGGPCGGDA